MSRSIWESRTNEEELCNVKLGFENLGIASYGLRHKRTARHVNVNEVIRCISHVPKRRAGRWRVI